MSISSRVEDQNDEEEEKKKRPRVMGDVVVQATQRRESLSPALNCALASVSGCAAAPKQMMFFLSGDTFSKSEMCSR